jgi:colanic acid/amylovoran biosynthesis glycosyltransferase
MIDSRRHLGYVLKRFPRISETFIAAEIIELERQGEHVTVFAISRPDEPFSHAFLGQMKAKVVYLPYRPWRQPRRVARSVVRVMRTDLAGWLRAAAVSLWPPRPVGLRHLLQATVLRDEMRRARITHAHAHFATSAARLANLAWRMGGPSYSVTAHAKDIYHHDVRVDHLRDKLGSARFVATVSEANRVHLETILGREARLRVIPNAVDLHRFNGPIDSGRDPHLVLSVARLVEKKGLVDLVRACGMLVHDGLDVRLEIVGDGPEYERLAREANNSGFRVMLHGALPNERVVALYRRAAVFSLPCVVAGNGDRDGLPTSVLEAMALGVPVVTTALNGLRDVVRDGQTGLVVPEHDPHALARALRRLLTEPDLALRLAHNGRRHVADEFSLERSVAALRQQFPVAA